MNIFLKKNNKNLLLLFLMVPNLKTNCYCYLFIKKIYIYLEQFNKDSKNKLNQIYYIKKNYKKYEIISKKMLLDNTIRSKKNFIVFNNKLYNNIIKTYFFKSKNINYNIYNIYKVKNYNPIDFLNNKFNNIDDCHKYVIKNIVFKNIKR
jgi:hypothetical protein